jgi:hypothetical protein
MRFGIGTNPKSLEDRVVDLERAVDQLFGFHGRLSPRIKALHMDAGECNFEVINGHMYVKAKTP